jgi:hypothetical protein
MSWEKENGKRRKKESKKMQLEVKRITCHYYGKVGHMKKHYKKRLVD